MPQIRFAPRESESGAVVAQATAPAASAATYLGAPSVSPQVVSPGGHGRVEAGAPRRLVGGLDRQAALRSALNAGVIAAVLSLVPTGVVLGPIVAGFFCVTLYRRRSLGQEPSKAAAFRLGMLCGAFGSLLFEALTAAIAYLDQEKFRSAMIELVRRAQVRNPDPQKQQALEYFMTPHGFVIMLILLGLLTCVMFVLLGGVGGIISASIGRRRGQ